MKAIRGCPAQRPQHGDGVMAAGNPI